MCRGRARLAADWNWGTCVNMWGMRGKVPAGPSSCTAPFRWQITIPGHLLQLLPAPRHSAQGSLYVRLLGDLDATCFSKADFLLLTFFFSPPSVRHIILCHRDPGKAYNEIAVGGCCRNEKLQQYLENDRKASGVGLTSGPWEETPQKRRQRSLSHARFFLGLFFLVTGLGLFQPGRLAAWKSLLPTCL